MDMRKHVDNLFREVIGTLLVMKEKNPDLGREIAVTVTMTEQAYAWFEKWVVSRLPKEEE